MSNLIIFLYLCIVDRLEVISQLKTEAFTASTFFHKRNLNAKNMIGIYKITSPSNKIYIGQSTNIESRWKQYESLKCSKQHKLYNSLKKYGVDLHTFEIIEECELELLNERERHWQDFYEVIGEKGLNCKLTQTDDKSGFMCKESREKLSKAQSGENNFMRGKSGEKHPNFGKKWSEESRKKMSEGQKKLLASGYIHTSSKLVLDLETGFFYDSATEAWQHNKDYIKCNIKGFSRKLSGGRLNNTKFIYA